MTAELFPSYVDECNKLFEEARIPFPYWSQKLSEHECGGSLTEYLRGPLFKVDSGHHVGVNVWSAHAPNRVGVFPLFVRSLVLYHLPIHYVSLLTVCDACAADGHPIYEKIATGPLAVHNMLDTSKPFPFIEIERVRIEQFLMGRSEHGHINYYCAKGPMQDMTAHWSETFVAHQQQFVRDIEIL